MAHENECKANDGQVFTFVDRDDHGTYKICKEITSNWNARIGDIHSLISISGVYKSKRTLYTLTLTCRMEHYSEPPFQWAKQASHDMWWKEDLLEVRRNSGSDAYGDRIVFKEPLRAGYEDTIALVGRGPNAKCRERAADLLLAAYGFVTFESSAPIHWIAEYGEFMVLCEYVQAVHSKKNRRLLRQLREGVSDTRRCATEDGSIKYDWEHCPPANWWTLAGGRNFVELDHNPIDSDIGE